MIPRKILILALLCGLAAACREPAPTPAPAPRAPAAAAPAAPAALPTAPTPAALPAEVTPTAAIKVPGFVEDEPLDTGRLRRQPRKQAKKLEVDLDGDGRAELCTLSQQQPAADWQGEPAKGPHFVAEIRRGDAVLVSRRVPGWARGWSPLTVRRGEGRLAAFLIWEAPGQPGQRAAVAQAHAGGVTLEDLDVVAVEHWDLRGDGRDAVLATSQELFADFLRTGRTRLLDLSGPTPADLLPFPAFEACALPAATGPWSVVAVERQPPRLHLLRADGAAGLRSVQQLAVTPPDDGGQWSAPAGFALSCLPDAAEVRYKDQRFTVQAGRLRPLRAR